MHFQLVHNQKERDELEETLYASMDRVKELEGDLKTLTETLAKSNETHETDVRLLKEGTVSLIQYDILCDEKASIKIELDEMFALYQQSTEKVYFSFYVYGVRGYSIMKN